MIDMNLLISKSILFIIMITIFSGINVFAESNFSGERLKSACIEFLQKKVSGDLNISVTKIIEDQNFVESGVVARCYANVNHYRGNFFITLEFSLNDRVIRRIDVPVKVQIFRQVPIALNSISRGSTIKETDIIKERKDISGYNDSELISFYEVIDSKAKSNISKGAVITKHFLQESNIINRGDRVIIIVQSGAVQIRTTGVALQDGSFGETIRVRRDGIAGSSSSKTLQGNVTQDGTVIIAGNK